MRLLEPRFVRGGGVCFLRFLKYTPARTEEPGGLPPMGSHRVGHNRPDLAAAAAAVFITSLIIFKAIFSRSS